MCTEQIGPSYAGASTPKLFDFEGQLRPTAWTLANRSFLIDCHPTYPSLVLGVGGSGHGFMHIPTVGGFIVDAMEKRLDPRLQHSFRWEGIGRTLKGDWEVPMRWPISRM